jgi:DnaK suppressor protein
MADKTAILRSELDELRTQIATLESTLEDTPEYGLGTGAPSVTRWEIDRALLRRLEEQAASIEHTLSTLAEDTYGICRQCGRSIHPDRLAVLPGTRICIRCARASERKRAH